MKRLEVVGKSFTFTDDIDPQYKSLSFQVQVLRGQYNYVRAEFFLEGQELANFLAGDRDYEKLAEEKMRWILELNTTPVDAYMLETMQREQREILGSVEETKTAAIEAASAVADDTKIQAIAAATEAAMEVTEEVKVQAVQAATQSADTQTAILRTALRKFVRIDELQPEDIADLVGLYDPWMEGDAVAVGDIRSYEDKLYKVVQAHTTQADWTPDATPALWTEIAPPVTEDGEEIVPLCHTVTGAHDVYALGQMCKETDGVVYRSTIDNNAYRPKDYPDHWEQVEDTTEPAPTEPEEPEEPPEEPTEPEEPEEPEEPSEPDVPDFVQPTGEHDAYKTGDRVLFEGKIYESTIDANTWSPSDYPQGWKEVTV